MDNLAVHKSTDAKAAYQRLKITPIYNLPYSPQFNGIESYFSLVKGQYKKLLLKSIMNDLDFDVPRLIKQSIENVNDKKAIACARYGREEIEKQQLI